MNKRAIVILSGGLDSATVAMLAKARGWGLYVLTFDYGQRHGTELASAKRVIHFLGEAVREFRIFNLKDFGALAQSSLTDRGLQVTKDRHDHSRIPSSYVPCRNLVFLSIAAAWAESLEIRDIFLGVNAVDYSGYPDCRPEFLEAFMRTLQVGSKAGVEGRNLPDQIMVHAPLITMTKGEIIKLGVGLGLDYRITHSCYDPVSERACGRCDSCMIRRRGFEEAGVADPTMYSYP